jgi:multidrug efflux pump subunit AcrA (membrane-fusion protein)
VKIHSIPYVFLLAVSALSGCTNAEASHLAPTTPPVIVKLAQVHEEKLDALYRTNGTVRGRTTAILTSRTMGYVRRVDVRPGDRVVAGQVLAVLDAKDSAASVRRARAGFSVAVESRTEAENGLLAAQAALKIAKSTHARVALLAQSQAITPQGYDEAESQLQAAVAQEEIAQARLRASSSRIDQATAEVGETQAMLDYASIVAPFTGQVIERRIDPGNLASPGMPLLVLEQQGALRVETAVDESRVASIVLGDHAQIEIEALGRSIDGTVGEIVPTVDVASRAFLVKVDLPRELIGLRPGMFGRVGFRVGSRSPLVVPTSAVTQNGALDRVFVAEREHLRLRMVTLGERQGQWTEVLTGLDAGERVVATPAASLHDGANYQEQP